MNHTTFEAPRPARWRNVDAWMIAFLAGLFAFAGVDKALHVPGFINAINSYAVLPIPIGHVLAPLIIAAELSVAVGLLYRPWRRLAALQGAVLMVVLTIGLATNRLAGDETLCGCWFSISMAQGNTHFVLNAILIGMSVSIWFSSRKAPVASAPY